MTTQAITMATQTQPTNWWQRNWKWFVPVLGLAHLLFFAGIVMLIFGIMKNTYPYQDSLRWATNDAQVQAQLGTPLKPSMLVLGTYRVNNGSGIADLHYTLTGPKGSAKVTIIGTRTGNKWTYTTCTIDLPDATLNLLATPAPTTTSPGKNTP